MPWTSPLRAFTSLRHRNFRLLWFGQIVSALGSWIQSIGQAWLVLQLTDSAWQLGLVGAIQFVPILLFSLLGGVFADRWPKRYVLLITQIVAMLQALLLWMLVMTNTMQLWHLYLLGMLLGTTSSIDLPTRRAFIIEVVGREDLPNAIALSSSITTLARIIGPSLAGVLIAISSVKYLFLINALSFVPVILGLLLINASLLHMQVKQATTTSTWQSLQEGLNYVWHTPTVWLMIFAVGFVLLFGSNFNIILPLFATDVLHIDAMGFGFLSGSLGIGAFLGTLGLAWHNKNTSLTYILIGMFLFAILEIAFSFTTHYPLALLLIASIGFVETIFAAQAMTALQAIIPDQLRGRVMSVQVLFFDGSVPLGYIFVGWLTHTWGAPIALLSCALCCMLVVGASWLFILNREELGATLSP